MVFSSVQGPREDDELGVAKLGPFCFIMLTLTAEPCLQRHPDSQKTTSNSRSVNVGLSLFPEMGFGTWVLFSCL